MTTISKRVEERIVSALKRYQPVLAAQRDRDVSEADTVTLVKDLLSDLFGYDKYSELTSEHAIRGTYCDLAVRIDNTLRLLIEVKAIGLKLNDKHIRQAVDYASNQGVDWVALTNGAQWRLFRLHFKKPIESRLIAEFDLLALDPRAQEELQKVFLLTKEGIQKGAPQEFSERQDATSRFVLASILCNSEDVISAIRREVRRVSDVLVAPETIATALKQEVIKRETLEGEEAVNAARAYSRRSATRASRTGKEEDVALSSPAPEQAPPDSAPPRNCDEEAPIPTPQR